MTRRLLTGIACLVTMVGCGGSSTTATTDPSALLTSALDRIAQQPAIKVSGRIVPPSRTVRNTSSLASFLRGERGDAVSIERTTSVGGRPAAVVLSRQLEATIATDGTPDLVHATITVAGRSVSGDLVLAPVTPTPAITAVASAVGQNGTGAPLAQLTNYC